MDGDAPARPRDPYLRSRGLKIPKDGKIVTGRIRGALKREGYEAKECEAMMHVVAPGDTVLELGAGIGYMSTLIAVKKPGCRVVSYEANPALLPFIAELHAANGVEDVTVRNALLSDSGGEPVPFHVRRNILASSMDASVEAASIERSVEVAREDIHAVLAELRPDVLICDIEGAEAHLLPAADLSCLRAAIVELHPQWIGQDGVQGVFDAFHRAGLTYYPKASHAKVVTFRKGW